jgi:hypothetical protein
MSRKLTKRALEKKLQENVRSADLIAFFGVTEHQFYYWSRKWGLAKKRCLDDEIESPSIEEIASRAADVRAGWSEDEMERRACGRHRAPYSIPVIATSDLVGEVEAPAYARI